MNETGDIVEVGDIGGVRTAVHTSSENAKGTIMAETTVQLAPMDTYNQTLIDRAHPNEWQNPEPADSYNLVVIGGGTAGLVSAAGAAALGAKVALIERHLMGGDCLNVGCVPSKGIIGAARAVAAIGKGRQFGLRIADAHIDFAIAMERMRKIRAEIAANDSVERFAGLGVDVFLGHGKFTGPKTVTVDGKTLRFSKAVIATGARASAPAIPGLEESGYLTNETLFSLTELPKRLGVIGAGPIGSEMAQSFARFGSEVHVLEIGDQVLSKEPANIAAIVEKSLVEDGVHLRKSCRTKRIEKRDGETIIHIDAGNGDETLTVDALLVSVGRKPNVEDLGLEEAGVSYDPRTGVNVNDYLQTSNRRIYAAGDISSMYKFTHTADALAAIVIQNALFFRTKKASSLIIPWATYTDPELAHVGMYPADAEKSGIETETFSANLGDNDRALLEGEERGLVEIYTKRGSDKILGATIVAGHAGEMISEITVAMKTGAGLATLSSTIHPYPTQSDAVRSAARAYFKSRLTPRIKRLMDRWMAWHR